MRKVTNLALLSILSLSGCASVSANDHSEMQYTPMAQAHQYNNASVPVSSKPDHVARLLLPLSQVEPRTEGTEPAQDTHLNVTGETKAPTNVKGIYVSAWKANGASLERLISLLNQTELNAMVIDVKNDSGQVTYDSNVALANEIGSDDTKPISDIRGLLKKLKENNIYAIARIVAFKDPYLSSVRTNLAMHTKSGGVWRDKKGVFWVDPYHPDVQAYNIALAKEAAELGFDEVQFDYVRFPENGKKVGEQVNFYNQQGVSKAELIQRFLQEAKRSIPTVPLSADVFGLTSSTDDDMGIGQEWDRISTVVDTISPMVYPSHYSDGTLGIVHPDLQPYDTVKKAMQDAIVKNKQIALEQKPVAQVRPWLQDFTAKWIKNHQTYGAKQIREQIKAVEELGFKQYLLWNPSCTYTYSDKNLS